MIQMFDFEDARRDRLQYRNDREFPSSKINNGRRNFEQITIWLLVGFFQFNFVRLTKRKCKFYVKRGECFTVLLFISSMRWAIVERSVIGLRYLARMCRKSLLLLLLILLLFMLLLLCLLIRGGGVFSRLNALTWQGSCLIRKCSSVSQPPPTRTIVCRPFNNCNNTVTTH